MDMQLDAKEFRIHLQNEWARRARLNARYSLRSFARQLELDPSTVSQILSGKRRVSPGMIRRVCGKIGWPRKAPDDAAYILLNDDVISALSDWYHYALLELTAQKSFRAEPEWVAKKLAISVTEARTAIDRLRRLGMLIERNGRWTKAQTHYVNYQPGEVLPAQREYQRQVIQKALTAVEACPPEKKDITCINIAADSRKLEAARGLIKKFRRDLCAFLEDGEADSVYLLSVQLFPVSKDEN